MIITDARVSEGEWERCLFIRARKVVEYGKDMRGAFLIEAGFVNIELMINDCDAERESTLLLLYLCWEIIRAFFPARGSSSKMNVFSQFYKDELILK